MISRRRVLRVGTAMVLGLPAIVRAERAKTIKIGVITDLSGPFRDLVGEMSIAAAKQAINDIGKIDYGIEIVSGDYESKADVAASMARQWLDRDGVDVIVDVPLSSAALAINSIVREKNKVFLATGPSVASLTGDQCSPNTVHWCHDAYMDGRSTGGAVTQRGGTTWYFLIADYASGQQMQKNTARFVADFGGNVLGNSPYPFPETTDFSAFLLQAQASGAKVLGLANSGSDTINCVKQAHEFGLNKKMTIVAMVLFINDVHTLGLEMAQGMMLTEYFYWNLNSRTRSFTQRFMAMQKPKTYPNSDNAGTYAAVFHYLKAVSVLGIDQAKADGAAVVSRMKSMPCDDDAFGPGSIREDGRQISPSYLFQVKSPSESTGPWDYYKLIAATPADRAFQPLAEEKCPLIKF